MTSTARRLRRTHRLNPVLRGVFWVLDFDRRFRERQRLERLTPHELQDIGLSRAQLERLIRRGYL